MATRLSRRPGPEHPVLFLEAADIPEPPPPPPMPRSADGVAPFRDVLEAAEAITVAEAAACSPGRTVTVGGERRPPDPLWGGDALLDDGTGVLAVLLPSGASRALRAALGARFVLIAGVVREHEGASAIVVGDIADLRPLARDLRALTRR